MADEPPPAEAPPPPPPPPGGVPPRRGLPPRGLPGGRRRPIRAWKAHVRLLGIPIRFDPSFFLIAALLGLARPEPLFIATWVGVVLVSIIVHEMGHAIFFRAFGFQPRITLHAMGGTTEAEMHRPLPPGKSIIVTLAGPVFGLALGGIVLVWALAARPIDSVTIRVVVSDLLWVNLGWSLLNLVPLLPLDGGQVMAGIIDLVTGGKGRGRVAAHVISVIVAVGGGVAALLYGLPFAALLAGLFGFQNAQAVAASRATRADRPLLGQLQDADRRLSSGYVDAAAATAEDVLAKAKSRELRAVAAGVAASAQESQMAAGRNADAAALGERVFARFPDPRIAYDVARAWTRLGRRDLGLLWLEKAVDSGFRDAERLESDEDLVSLRGTPVFEDLRRRISEPVA